METPAEPPSTEAEPPPAETTTPAEPETTTEAPGSTTESPSHPAETTAEAPSPAAAGPGPSSPSSPSASSPGSSPARHHGSTAKGGGSAHPAGQKSAGGADTIRVPDPLKSVSSSVDSLLTSALPPAQIEKVGELLAESGLAPKGDKPAQRRAARKIIGALGSAGLGAALSLSPPKPAAAPQPIPFVPIHGGPKYLYLALLALLLGGVGTVLFFQLRPVVRSRQPRPPLISSLDAGSAPGAGTGPGRVSLPRDPARAPDRPNPGRRTTR